MTSIETLFNEPTIMCNILKYMTPENVVGILSLNKELNKEERFRDTINVYFDRKRAMKEEMIKRKEVYVQNIIKLFLKLEYNPYCVKRLYNLLNYMSVNDDLWENTELIECHDLIIDYINDLIRY